MSEPRTEAGRLLLQDIEWEYHAPSKMNPRDRRLWVDRIRRLERVAARVDVDRLARALADSGVLDTVGGERSIALTLAEDYDRLGEEPK